MAERDLKRAWENEKRRNQGVEARIVVKTTVDVNADFEAKCIANGTNRNAILKQFILEYTYGERANEIPASVGQQKRKNPDRDLDR